MNFYAATTEYAAFEAHVPAPCFRCSFTVTGASAASLAITTPGFYELFVNGARITKGRFSPGVTNPDHMLTVDHYDILPHLRDGENVIALLLGNGIANCIGWQTWNGHIAPWRAAPSVALDAKIAHAEGKIALTAGDFVTVPSAIVFDDMRAGEITTAEPVETNALTGSGLEVMDWDGKTFTVPTSKPSNLSFQNFEEDAEMENGDILNDAVYNRNRTLEELLNVKITESVLETR